MKLFVSVFIFLTCIVAGNSQTFDVETIVDNGNNDSRINIIVLGDGYQASELNQFKVDSEKFSNYLFTQSPYKEYQNYFNVHIIKVPSNESGANHPGTATDVTEPAHPVKTVDNYFGSSFDTAGIHRLLTVTNFSRINNVLVNNFPNYDQVFVLVNSVYYGGAGGTFAVASTGSGSDEVAVHEMGHSFANLADEYWAGDQYAFEQANLTKEDNPALVKWKNWLGQNQVGIFPHNGTTIAAQWNRPHQNCKMRLLGNPFCSVCKEAIIETIHQLINPVGDYSPTNVETIENPTFPLELNLNTIAPIPNTLEFTWTLNGSTLSNTEDNLILDSNDLQTQNTVSVSVEDKSNFLEIDNHEFIHRYTITWQINTSTDTDNDGVENANDLCPNTPANAVVDSTGCEAFSLPNNNFSISTISESCISSDNGSIEISANQALDYVAVLDFPNQEQQTLDFGQNTMFTNLSAGRYGLCLFVAGEDDFEQCYELEIGEPEPLSVSSKVNSIDNKIELDLSGGDTYYIELNGKNYATTESSITLPLEEIDNFLSVKTEKECQGNFLKNIFLNTKILVSPNPVGDGELNIFLDSEISDMLDVTINDLNGRTLVNKSVLPVDGVIKINVSGLSAGMYLLNVKTNISLIQFKVMKK